MRLDACFMFFVHRSIFPWTAAAPRTSLLAMEKVNTDGETTSGGQEPLAAMQQMIAQSQQVWAAWGTTAREQLAAWEKATHEFATIQDQGVRRAEEAADEVTRLFKASMAHAHQVQAQVRDMGVSAIRRTLETMTNRPTG
jgi:hypothetical protein